MATHPNMTQLLGGKVALVTGAASGIGSATARLFAQHGAAVVVVDWNSPAGQKTADDIRERGGQAVFVQADVGRMGEIQLCIDAATDHFGKLDIIHSNAASYKLGSATEISEEEWDRTQGVCLKATWMLAHYGMPLIVKQGGGSFVITASVQGIRGYTRHAAYQAAKGGLTALTRSLAADYAPSVRVNCILPGAVLTGLAAGLSQKDLEAVASMCPLKRIASPEEIAAVALFLASELSSYMTGSCLVVDGGLTSTIRTP
jgi:NAD(P)-dependent dehydrogenase (short-subunit alcohol dehydrogenase family)